MSFEFPSAWPYGYSGAQVPGGGVVFRSGLTVWPLPGSNPPEEDKDMPTMVPMMVPAIESETRRSARVRWNVPRMKVQSIPFSIANWGTYDQSLSLPSWFVAKNDLWDFAQAGHEHGHRMAHSANPYEEQEEIIYGANPEYPEGEAAAGYEGMRVRYEPETMPDWGKFDEASDIFQFSKSREMLDDTRERVYAVYTDMKHRPIGYRLVGAGSLAQALVHPREIFGPATALAAGAVAIVHNHPSGDPTPSPDDRALAKRLKEASDLMGIHLLDFVVVARNGYYSFQEHGLV